MKKVWRHPDGREFPVASDGFGGFVRGSYVFAEAMCELGYELVTVGEVEPPEPPIVKPVVFSGAWESGRMTVAGVALFSIPFHNEVIYPHCKTVPEGTEFTVTIRPKAQQTERGRLEREFVESLEDKTIFDPAAAIALRDFLKKEQA